MAILLLKKQSDLTQNEIVLEVVNKDYQLFEVNDQLINKDNLQLEQFN